MQKLHWMKSHLPGGTLESGLDRVNALFWAISVETRDSVHVVYSGEKPIFSADSKEAVETFLYGLTLVYAVIPDEAFEILLARVQDIIS